jgi:thioredoxin-related protein
MRFVARLFLAVLALLPLASSARAVEWKRWNPGLAAAASSRRPVLVDVCADWNRWCGQMDREVYARADVREYLAARFVTIQLDAESPEALAYKGRNYTARSLATSFDVSGYPTTIFLASNGDHLVSVPGYVEPDRFLLLLRWVGDGHRERGVKWDDFVKQPDGAK